MVLSWRLQPHEVMVVCLTDEEDARFRMWKAQYVYQPANFEDEMVTVGEIDIDEAKGEM